MYHRRRSVNGLASLIPLQTATKVPLRRQLYQGLQRAIVSRQLPGGTRLPSSRVLAGELEMSRTTVVEVYQQLLLEGYLEGRRGSGTYISRTVPDALLAPVVPPSILAKRGTLHPSLSQVSLAVSRSSADKAPGKRAFWVGQPALEAFPHVIWQRLVSRCYRRSWQDLFGYQDSVGYRPLREAIAAYLGVARSVRCTAEQVIITSSSQQGLDLVIRTLMQRDDSVWMEDPGYSGARWAFQKAGLTVVPVPIDSAGLDVTAAKTLAPSARLAFITPSHQFPLGTTMGLERRLTLLAWAAEQQSWIIEDDCGCEYRYAGRPLPALQGLDDAGRVLYVGTFSNILFPALRLGYLVAPPALVDTLASARRDTDLHPPALEQAVLADFIMQEHFVRHVRRMRALYAERQEVLRSAIDRYMSGVLEVHPDPAGMHLMAWLPSQVETSEPIVQAARADGVELLPLSSFSMQLLGRQGLVLGYAGFDDDQIVEGVRTLSRVLERTLKRSLYRVACEA